jgi:tetratricopeptide (TPR) repeat protein
MSHFAVLVIGDNVEEQLAKFDENIEMPRYVKATKAELIEKQRQDILEYKKNYYDVYMADPEAYSVGARIEHINYLANEFPLRLNWTDEELYAEATKYYEESEIGPEGEAYSTYNPDSKWDWYQIGGRYAGRLHLKEGVEKDQDPNFSWGWDAKTMAKIVAEPRVDSARVKDIDWAKIHLNQKDYDEAIRFWEMKVEGAEPQTDEERDALKWDWYRDGYYQERYGNKETYAKCMASFTMWAIVKDGVWYEKGNMGWWASSDETHDEAVAWELNMYDKFIKDLPEDTLLTVVDCHI